MEWLVVRYQDFRQPPLVCHRLDLGQAQSTTHVGRGVDVRNLLNVLFIQAH